MKEQELEEKRAKKKARDEAAAKDEPIKPTDQPVDIEPADL